MTWWNAQRMECNATCNDADEVVAGRVMGHAVMRSVFTEVATQKEWIIYGVYNHAGERTERG